MAVIARGCSVRRDFTSDSVLHTSIHTVLANKYLIFSLTWIFPWRNKIQTFHFLSASCLQGVESPSQWKSLKWNNKRGKKMKMLKWKLLLLLFWTFHFYYCFSFARFSPFHLSVDTFSSHLPFHFFLNFNFWWAFSVFSIIFYIFR